MTSDSWEIASVDSIIYKKKEKSYFYQSRFKIISSFIKIGDIINKKYKYIKIDRDINVFEKQRIIDLDIALDRNDQSVKKFSFLKSSNSESVHFNFSKFISYNLSGIQCRIYFVFDEEITTFLEYFLGNLILHTQKKSSFVISLDFNGNLKNASAHFTSKATYISFFERNFNIFKNNFEKNIKISSELPLWSNLDAQRDDLKPTTLEQVKLSYNYTAEKFLHHNEIIFPKRKFSFTIKNQKIYKKDLVFKLHTIKKWRELGYEAPNATIKPFKIYKNQKLFAIFQLRQIEDKRVNLYVPNVQNCNLNSYFTYHNSNIEKILLKDLIIDQNDYNNEILQQILSKFSFLEISSALFLSKTFTRKNNQLFIQTRITALLVDDHNKDVSTAIVNDISYKYKLSNLKHKFYNVLLYWEKVIKKGKSFIKFYKKLQ